MGINKLTRFKPNEEAENFCQISSNIARQKLNSHISSQTTRQTVRQTNVKNELKIFPTVIMVKFNKKLNINFRYDRPFIPIKTIFSYGKQLILI